MLNLNEIRYFEFNPENHSISEINNKIAEAIRAYFLQYGDPLKGNEKNILNLRIAWALEQKSIPHCLKPVFLTYMTVCCKRGITGGKEYLLPKQTNGFAKPQYDARVGKPEQRCAQLVLLNRLCDIFTLGREDRYKNWNQYLYWQGKEIISGEETTFWREQLGKEYESLPAIGFQLCCADYLQDCVPIHLENLSYTKVSKLHLKGYSRFWSKNKDRIISDAKQLGETHEKTIREYRKIWKHAKEYYFTGKEWLDGILQTEIAIDLSEFECVSNCDEDELKRLILETELQLCICRKARSKLIKLCQSFYGLQPGLFQELEF